MRINTSITCAVTNLTGNLAAVLAPYYLLHDIKVVVTAIFVSGLAVAMICGWIFGRPYIWLIGITAFIVIFVLWMPVVIATYGFALLAMPFLAAYALLAIAGALLGSIASSYRSSNAE